MAVSIIDHTSTIGFFIDMIRSVTIHLLEKIEWEMGTSCIRDKTYTQSKRLIFIALPQKL